MLPKKHILYGGIFSSLAWTLFPNIGPNALTIFLASFLIDADHYFAYALKRKNLNLRKAYKYFREMHEKLKIGVKNGKNIKSPLVIFHTVESLLLLLILSIFYPIFLFIFIGFVFHNILDMIDIQCEFGSLAPRDYSMIQYIINKKNKKYKYL